MGESEGRRGGEIYETGPPIDFVTLFLGVAAFDRNEWIKGEVFQVTGRANGEREEEEGWEKEIRVAASDEAKWTKTRLKNEEGGKRLDGKKNEQEK